MLPSRISWMERKNKVVLISFVVLLAAALIFFEYIQPIMQEREIKRLLDEANYCSSDADCTILDTNFGCPFDCYNLGNKNANLTKVMASWEAYQESRRKSGSFCIYGCIEPPRPEEIKCVNNTCVDARRF